MPRIENMNQYNEHYQQSLQNMDEYWSMVASEYQWEKKHYKAHSGDFDNCDIKWFEGGELNISVNCLDRHLETRGEKIAVIWEPNDPAQEGQSFTYKQLHKRVTRFSNILKKQNIGKGDVVCFYMPMIPELMIGVLACARLGATHSVVFGGFSANALKDRINDCQAKILVTADGTPRGNKEVPLKEIADQAVEGTKCIESVIVVRHTETKVEMKDNRDLWWHELHQDPSVEEDCPATIVDSEHPLFILYTSGSTGKPKGLLHTTAGYMVYAGHTFNNVFQMQEQDVYWCTADIGWITGHTYLTYGPLLNGATTVMFEGVPTWPTPARFWEVVEKYKVTHFYTAPTAIRALEACDIDFVNRNDLSSLKVLGSVGEPINEEAWSWYYRNVGKGHCPIVDTWWQTETGGIMISALAGVSPIKPTYATRPMPGVELALMDEKGNEITDSAAEGNLCIKKPWPGMARTIYGDHERYKQTYFSTYPGLYFTGDGAKRDEEGMYRITGRVDDVINVSGHRIGTAEVEDAINQYPAVVESAVVGFPHEIKGQGIYAYVILQSQEEDEQELIKNIIGKVTEIIGPIAKPDHIQIVSGLPKTRSGKIMRRILRKIAANDLESLGDTSTLLNPEIVEEIKENRSSK